MTSSTRAVLEHLPAREQVLTQLVAALRPGGWLLVEDTDFVSFVPGSGMTDADIELFARCWTLTRAAGEARGSDANYGRQLFGTVSARHLSDVAAEGRVTIARGGTPVADAWRLTTEQMRGTIVGPVRLSAQELDRYLTVLQDREAVWMMPVMVAVWGRRPDG